MTKFQKFIATIISGMSLIIFACAEPSETEKQARRENAFDLAGNYAGSQASGSALDFTMKIDDVGPRSTIQVSFDRSLPLKSAEREPLEKLGMSVAQAEAMIGTHLNFHPANDAKDHGGANVSDDFGKTSTIRVQTDDYVLDNENKFYFYLTGVFKKEDLSFQGRLQLYAMKTESTVEKNGQPSTVFKMEQAEIGLIAKTHSVFWTQYFGSWHGKVEIDLGQDVVLKSLPEFNLVKISDETFSLNPKLTEFSFQSEKFIYRSQNLSIKTLKDEPVPFIEMQWIGDKGNRVVLAASFWSLGQCTGNLLWISNDKEIVIGGFELSRI